jgi:hypothetical protein
MAPWPEIPDREELAGAQEQAPDRLNSTARRAGDLRKSASFRDGNQPAMFLASSCTLTKVNLGTHCS